MGKFLFLRIVAIITLVSITSIMIYIIYLGMLRIRTAEWLWITVFESAMALFVGHSASVLYMYHRCYPDKELSQATDIFYRITSYGSGTICFLLLIGIMFIVSDGPNNDGTSWLVAVLAGLFITAFAAQLFAGRQLYRVIGKNARRQLENSFT